MAAEGNVFDVEIFGERVPATVVPEPLWDLQGERVKA
jgi:hypothetical protein